MVTEDGSQQAAAPIQLASFPEGAEDPKAYSAPQRPLASFDIRANPRTDPNGTASSEEYSDSENDFEDDQAEADIRYEWQHMLSNVLQGEVLKTEKTRISGTLTNDNDDSTNSRKWRAYQIWLRVRAYVRGRTVQQEADFLDEGRNHIENIWAEVAEFRVKSPEEMSERSDGQEPPDAHEQIAMMVGKIEWCDGLYPSSKSMRSEKAHAVETHIDKRIDALLSWQSITKRLKTQISILQKWTGSQDLEVTQPGKEAIDEASTEKPSVSSLIKPAQRLLDTSTFIERLSKEDSLQKTLEKRTIADIYRLVHDAKSVVINLNEYFTEMNLPSFSNDLVALVKFPTNLVQEALKLRLASVERLSNEPQPSAVLVDELTNGFRSGLSLAAKLKQNFLEIMEPNPEKGWPGGTLNEEYDEVLLDSLRFFFKLLNWKLKSGSRAIYLKETEIVENEWKFLSEAVQQIDGGDILVGEHFWLVFIFSLWSARWLILTFRSTLTHRLLMRVVSYFGEQLAVLEERNMSASETSRWFNQTLDNVRLRHRKLLRFGRYAGISPDHFYKLNKTLQSNATTIRECCGISS